MSTIRLPIGSWIGRPAPIAAASGSSTSVTFRPPPANRTASSIARFSTSELIDGTATSTRGLGKRVEIERFTTTSSIRCVMSNSVMAPARSGRTATTLPESPPIRSQTSSPIARTSPVPPCSATTVGWSNTMPSPWR